MKKHTKHSLQDVIVAPEKLNNQQPLGRFLIVLFKQFENELLLKLKAEKIEDVLPSDFNVLRYIAPEGSLLKEIVNASGVSKQAISQIADDLVQRKFVKKIPSADDKRSKKLVFTKKGRLLIEKCIEVIQSIENKYEKVVGGKNNFDKIKTDLNKIIQSNLSL